MKGADWMSQLAAGRSSWGRELTHSIHSVFGGGDKVKDKDKDKDKLKVHRRPNICYIFEKQAVQGYQL